jgi:uncharacterized protein
MKNPFSLSPSLPSKLFCGRKTEIKTLLQYAMGGASVTLSSQWGTGKTTLVKTVLSGLNRENYQTIYCDLSRLSTTEDFILAFYTGIVNSFGNYIQVIREELKHFSTGLIPSFSFYPEGLSVSITYPRNYTLVDLVEAIFKGLVRYLENKSRRALIVFDEFQEITKLSSGKQIEAVLRTILQSQRNITCFFVGSRRRALIEIFADYFRPFYKHSFHFPLENIPEDEFVPFICKRFKSSGKQCSEDLAREIYEYVDGNTYYAIKMSHIIWDSTEKVATKQIFNDARHELINQESAKFHAIFNGLNNMEKWFLFALAANPTDKVYATQFLSRHNLSQASVQKALKSLRIMDVVERDHDGYYRLTDPIFVKWCNQRAVIH